MSTLKNKYFYLKQNKFDTRKLLIKNFVWRVDLYGAETLTILKAEKAKIETFEV